MAAPTIISCAPATMFSGGQFVQITGTNFRLPYPVPTLNGPVPTPPPTVAVSFNGKPAKRVTVLSSSALTCIAPAGDAGAAVVTLQNLDSSGNPISGELATFSAAYARADLSLEDDLDRVIRTFLLMLRQQVIDNVVHTVSADFTDDGTRTHFNITNVASLPCIAVGGPTMKRNEFYNDISAVEQRGGTYVRRRYLRTVDLGFKLQVFDNLQVRALRIVATLVKVLDLNTYFEVQRDPNDASKGSVFYELDFGEPGAAGGPNESDVRVFAGEATLRGFTFEDVPGFVDSMVADSGGTVDNVTITTVEKQ